MLPRWGARACAIAIAPLCTPLDLSAAFSLPIDSRSADAATELRAAAKSPSQRITVHAADVGDEAGAAAAVAAAAAAHGGRLDVVIASAGVSGPKRFEETTAGGWEATYRVNVVGCRNVVAAALPFMSGGRSAPAPAAGGGARRTGGRIVLVSSQAGQTGVYGYTAYSVRVLGWVRECVRRASARARHTLTPLVFFLRPTPATHHPCPQASKFALRGLAEALGHELHTRAIRVSLAFPPDTDTPMLAEENKAKPAVTRLLSEATATVPAATVGAAIIAGVERWNPFISVGFDGWMLATLGAGMAPAPDVVTAGVQVATMGLWRAIGLAYSLYFYHLIGKHDGAAVNAGTKPATAAAATPAAQPLTASSGGGGSGGSSPTARPRRSSGSTAAAGKR
jgi:3-dehydrosphinganine reductase